MAAHLPASALQPTGVQGVRQVLEEPPSLSKLQFTPPAERRLQQAAQPAAAQQQTQQQQGQPRRPQQPLGQVRGLFTQPKQPQRRRLPWEQQQSRQAARRGDIEMQPVFGASTATTTVSAGLERSEASDTCRGAWHMGGADADARRWLSRRACAARLEYVPLPHLIASGLPCCLALPLQDAAVLRRAVEQQLAREATQQARQAQQAQQPPARVEEVDLTAEPSSSQAPPPARQQGRQGRQQQQAWRGPAQPIASAAGLAGQVAAVVARPAFDWQARLQELARLQDTEAFSDLHSDYLAPAPAAGRYDGAGAGCSLGGSVLLLWMALLSPAAVQTDMPLCLPQGPHPPPHPPAVLLHLALPPSAAEYLEAAREADRAKRRVLQLQGSEAQYMQQTHTALERAQPHLAMRAEAEAHRVSCGAPARRWRAAACWLALTVRSCWSPAPGMRCLPRSWRRSCTACSWTSGTRSGSGGWRPSRRCRRQRSGRRLRRPPRRRQHPRGLLRRRRSRRRKWRCWTL